MIKKSSEKTLNTLAQPLKKEGTKVKISLLRVSNTLRQVITNQLKKLKARFKQKFMKCSNLATDVSRETLPQKGKIIT
jgi:hypothetical protein